MENHKRIVYTASGPAADEGGRSFFSTLKQMWSELFSARELVWSLFMRDFVAKYRQSVFGVLWAVLLPVVMVAFFVGMNRSGILNIGEVNVPYPLYALLGLSIWSIFSTGLVACTNAIILAGPMVIKINFPKSALIIAATGQSLVELIIRTVLIAAVFLYYGITPDTIGLITGILCLMPIYFFMTGIGFVLSLAAGVVRDIVNVMSIALMGLMLVTPVLYPISGPGILAKVNAWNPLNYMVNVPRDFIISGGTYSGEVFLLISALSVLVFLMGWRLFYLAQTKIAERI
jgi:lipopolysaccharide transport system permease protein